MAQGGYYSVDSLKGVHVLVIGHEADARELLSAVLQYGGALVTAAASGDEALEVMARIKPDVLVIGVDPHDDGVTTLRRVRDLKPEDGGVVAIVAVAAASVAERARTAGFTAYLVAPVDPWELCRVIAGLAVP